MRNSSGVTLVSVLVASALIGVLAVIMATLFGTMAGYMNRATTQTDVDQAVSYIYGILSDRNLCDNALRTSAGAAVTWNYNSTPLQPVGRIEVGGSPVIQTPKVFSPSLKLLSMNLREPDSLKGEVGQLRTTVVKSGVTYNSISARLVLDFEVPKNMTGGALRERYINLTLGLDSSNVIRFCSPQADSSMKQLTCNASVIASQPSDYNSDCPAAPAPSCQRLYYVSQFLVAGNPICSCQWVCPPTVTTFTVVPPGPGPAGPGPGPAGPGPGPAGPGPGPAGPGPGPAGPGPGGAVGSFGAGPGGY